MIQAKCIEKFRNKQGQIKTYRLQDAKGETIDVTPQALKQAIINKRVEIINLTLTSDERLIGKKPPQPQAPKTQPEHKFPTDEKLNNIISKATVLGLPIKEVQTYCKHTIYIISKSDNDHMVIIPSNVTQINSGSNSLLSYLLGNIQVLGGSGLLTTAFAFYESQAQTLDLSNFNTSNVTDMSSMFSRCKAQALNLSSFNTSKVTNMKCMFYKCEAQTLNLSSFNTSKVTDMSSMFSDCKAQALNLSNFNTSNVTDMSFMFHKCQDQTLDLSNFNISKVTVMYCMFEECKAQITTKDPELLKKLKYY